MHLSCHTHRFCHSCYSYRYYYYCHSNPSSPHVKLVTTAFYNSSPIHSVTTLVMSVIQKLHLLFYPAEMATHGLTQTRNSGLRTPIEQQSVLHFDVVTE